jgi:hypothetical protein
MVECGIIGEFDPFVKINLCNKNYHGKNVGEILAI